MQNMTVKISDDVFERVEEENLRQAEEALSKGIYEVAENLGVLTLIKAGLMTQLNIMGYHIWNKIKEPKTISQLAEEISKDFDVPYETALEDVKIFLKDLIDSGFIIYE
ncbi:MAG: PqqD family peptide modification chaperone [Proteobacteria bacterium]|nr:PqqD family peptide modification chaperone [Pseudomonadota bacterium]